MSTALQIRNIADSIRSAFPEYAASLARLANLVASQERALDEIAADAAEDARLADLAGRNSTTVIPFPRRIGR